MQCIECSWVHHPPLTMKILSADDSLFSVRAPMPLSTLWTHYLDWSGRENCDTPNGSPWSGSCAFPRQHPLHQPFWLNNLKSTIRQMVQPGGWWGPATLTSTLLTHCPSTQLPYLPLSYTRSVTTRLMSLPSLLTHCKAILRYISVPGLPLPFICVLKRGASFQHIQLEKWCAEYLFSGDLLVVFSKTLEQQFMRFQYFW